MEIESQTSESSHPLEDFFIDTDLVLGRVLFLLNN